MLKPLDVRRVSAAMRYGLALFPRLLVIVAVLGFAVAAQAAPTPVKPKAAKPTPVKPRTVKPAGQKPTPVKASGQKPAKVQPKSGAKPAATRATKKIDPFEGNPSDSGNPSNANVRESELYGDRLDSLQADVDQLKDKIFRSKARLTLLKETVLRGVLAGSRVTVTHQNLMGSGFRLTRVVFIMDGAQIFARTDETGSLDGEDEVLVYDGNLPPGPHNVTVELTYQGNGYGVFSYLNGYTFESRSSHSFTAPENAAIKLVSQGFERGNMTTEMGDRPAVNWQEVPLDAAGRPLPKARNDKARAVKAKKDNR